MASSIAVLAARRLRRQVKQLTAQLDGLRTADDVEYVHRARVATRRLRAVLRVFEDHLPRTKLPKWKKALRRVGRGLGDARDKDVQIAYLDHALRGVGDAVRGVGVARVLAQWEVRRENLQPAVLRAAKQLRASGVLAEMMAFARRRSPSGKGAKQTKKIVPDAKLYCHAQQEIVRRIDDLRVLEECLVDPGDGRRHHQMRIAAKRLRYTLELFKGVYAGRVDAILESLKQLQTLLGDVHDCDVWLEQLDDFVRKHRRRMEGRYGHDGRLARWMPGIEYLLEDRRQRRREQFDTAVQFWQGLTSEGLWDSLLSIVEKATADQPPAGVHADVVPPPSASQSTVAEVTPGDAAAVGPSRSNGRSAPAEESADTSADKSVEAADEAEEDDLESEPHRSAPQVRGNGHHRPRRDSQRKPSPLAVGPAEVGS